MSNLLSDAIVDAKALREAALKSAETAVIEKYSNEVKKTLDQILEQDDLDLNLGGDLDADADPAPALEPDPALDLGTDDVSAPVEPIDEEDNVPLAATDDFSNLEGENLEGFPTTGEPVELTLDLGALQEAVENLQNSEEIEIDEQIIASIVSETLSEADSDGDGAPAAPKWSKEPGKKAPKWADKDDEDPSVGDDLGEAVAVAADDAAIGDAEETEAETDEFEKSGLEEIDLDQLTDEIMEKLTVDMGATLSGWAGRSSEDQKWEMEKALAHRRSTEVEEELKTLKKAHDELVFENNQISERNNQYEQVVEELKESLHDVNLSNARLLYTNRVLRNSSLNERQKEKIVEAISNAGSVTEAKTIYETLQSTVEAAPKRAPQSLSEAISNRSSVIRATRKESPSSDPLQDRMKRLAGIK